MKESDNQRNLTERDSLGRFAQGNPGRPHGAKAKASRVTLARIKAMEDGAIQKLWEAVLAKEKWAVEFVLSKILPASRTVEFEGVTGADIIAALEAGDITPEEAKSITATIRNLKEMDDIDQIRARLEELEQAVKNGDK